MEKIGEKNTPQVMNIGYPGKGGRNRGVMEAEFILLFSLYILLLFHLSE